MEPQDLVNVRRLWVQGRQLPVQEAKNEAGDEHARRESRCARKWDAPGAGGWECATVRCLSASASLPATTDALPWRTPQGRPRRSG